MESIKSNKDTSKKYFDERFCQQVISHVLKYVYLAPIWVGTQPAITCSKLTIETVEQCVKYVQS